MRMKILCLHGYGGSGAIFENQLRSLIQLTNEIYEFVFVDGEVECQKAPGLGTFVPGPFLCYTSCYAPSKVREVHSLITDVIDDQGPFDGVLGFSQGASMALAYLLQSSIDHPQATPPFRFAIFFSTVAALSPDDSFCLQIINSFTEEERRALATFPDTNFEILNLKGRLFCESLAKAVGSAKKTRAIELETDDQFFKGNDASIPRVMHPDFLTQRVQIPTVHITGREDSNVMVEQSILMHGLCDSRLVKVLEHSGGHDIPRDIVDVKAVISAIEWAVNQSRLQFW